MKKAVDVEILGQRFTVKSDAEETHVRQVADYVDEKMQQVLKGARSAGQFHVAMLAALNIADEYHQLKERYEVMHQRLSHLSKRLSNTLTEEG